MVGAACPSCAVGQSSSCFFRLKQPQPLMAHYCARLGIIQLSRQKTHTRDSLRFVLFVSVATDSVPLYDDVNVTVVPFLENECYHSSLN